MGRPCWRRHSRVCLYLFRMPFARWSHLAVSVINPSMSFPAVIKGLSIWLLSSNRKGHHNRRGCVAQGRRYRRRGCHQGTIIHYLPHVRSQRYGMLLGIQNFMGPQSAGFGARTFDEQTRRFDGKAYRRTCSAWDVERWCVIESPQMRICS
jgi:hypothetical protein